MMNTAAPAVDTAAPTGKTLTDLFPAPTGKTLTDLFPDPVSIYAQKIFDVCVQHIRGGNATFQFVYTVDEMLTSTIISNIQATLNNKYSGNMYCINLRGTGEFDTSTQINVRIIFKYTAAPERQ